LSSGEGQFKMRIPKDDFVSGTACSPAIRRSLKSTDFIISLRELNALNHQAGPHSKVDIDMVKIPDFIAMLRQTKDHREVKVYRKADIAITQISHASLRNYQTYASSRKISSIYLLNEFFAECGFSYSLTKTGLLLVRSRINSTGYAAFYVPPIVEYQNKNKVNQPLERLERRARKMPVLRLPGFDNNGDLHLQRVIDDWKWILSSSAQVVPILKDGTHRCECATLAGEPNLAVSINESGSLMQSVPIRTDMLVITSKKPKERRDRFLGVQRIGTDKWEGWVDLASAGIDG